MLPYRDSRITKVILVAFFIIIIGYAYFEARGLLYGPQISISSLNTEVHEPYILIQGKADHIASLSVNGGEIPVTVDGAFQEPLLLAEGYNRIVFDAKDTYGRTRQRILEIVYTPALPTNAALNTQTKATSTSTNATSSPTQGTP